MASEVQLFHEKVCSVHEVTESSRGWSRGKSTSGYTPESSHETLKVDPSKHHEKAPPTSHPQPSRQTVIETCFFASLGQAPVRLPVNGGPRSLVLRRHQRRRIRQGPQQCARRLVPARRLRRSGEKRQRTAPPKRPNRWRMKRITSLRDIFGFCQCKKQELPDLFLEQGGKS